MKLNKELIDISERVAKQLNHLTKEMNLIEYSGQEYPSLKTKRTVLKIQIDSKTSIAFTLEEPAEEEVKIA